jgi:transcriptional regulator with XRE-family HTH domain
MLKTIHDSVYQALVGKLRATRLQKGFRQADVAIRLGVTRTWIAKVEGHEIRLDVIQLVRYARILGLQAHRLVREVEKLV